MKTINTIDFFLVGAARCGTTSLYNYLNNSEDIFLPLVKEPNFFSDVDSPKTEDFELPKPNEKYHAKIITSKEVYDSLYEGATANQIKGDSSPSYLWDKNVAQSLYNHNPKAKIIISLRQPVDRAYSHYIMNYFTGVDSNNTFEKALEANKNKTWGSCNYYLEMGMYYSQVKAYFDVFPKEQIKILVYEDWTNNIELELNSVFKFLKIQPTNSIYTKSVQNNKIQPVKKMYLLNLLRQNKIKHVIKNVINQDRIDRLKSYFFSDKKEIDKIDLKLRDELSMKFSDDIKQLSELTTINFIQKWQ